MKRNTRLVYIILCCCFLFASILTLILWGSAAKAKDEEKTHSAAPVLPSEPDRETVLLKHDGLLTSKTVIDVSVIADGLNDMGVLVTEEYFFTEVVTSLKDNASKTLSRFIEALAVMIVTSCIIPLLVLILFIFLIRTATGITLPIPEPLRKIKKK